jgi:hypothetical protein
MFFGLGKSAWENRDAPRGVRCERRGARADEASGSFLFFSASSCLFPGEGAAESSRAALA